MTRIHPVTGAVLVRGTRSITLQFGNETRVVDMPGWYADDDLTGENGLHDPADMQVSDRVVSDFVGEISMTKRLSRLEELMDEAMREPTPTELEAAFLIESWQVHENPLGFMVLIGKIALPTGLAGAEIHTSPLFRLERGQGWARTFSSSYRLGKMAPGAADPTRGELLLAIDRNRVLIPTKPWMFETPGSSRC